MSTRRTGNLLVAPVFGRVRTRADKQKPHSFSFECGVLVAAGRNASGRYCRRGGVGNVTINVP